MKQLVIYRGDNYHHCVECDRIIVFGEMVACNKSKLGYICQKCILGETRAMSNIKITAEVDGKQVPLENISTETFEAIKALEKPKEIPVARLATFAGQPRLIFRPTRYIELKIGRVYALALEYGDVGADWPLETEDSWIDQYENIKPL